MQTIGFVGVGKLGLPISVHLVKSGYRVLGYRRSSMAEFESIGGIPARSPAEVGREADIVFSCMPSSAALDEVMQGPNGLVQTARAGQIVVELGSHPLADKQRQVAPFAAKGAVFVDGEMSGTPGMVAARKGVVYLSGDRDACLRVEEVTKAFAELSIYFGPFGAASKVKLINNLLVAVHITATAEAMALGLRAGVDTELMIKAIATGSGGSTQFGIRAPWMAERKFLPQQGSAPGLAHYFEMIDDLSAQVGVATPLLDRVKEIFDKGIPMIGERDVAAIIEAIEAWPRHG
jgi:3-hydroxyisobutyrate dehydrogenase-like beta-hydroxyacid dehydrogenase